MKLIKQKLGKVSITVEKDYWSDQRSYDRLVIVEVANVGCFLSRKFVPEGIQYTDREYWIKFGNGEGGGGGSDIEVVTDFGDSIVRVICQKTVTDRFNSTDNSIAAAINTAKDYTNTSLEGIYDRITNVEDDLSRNIRNNAGEIEQLWQFANSTQPVVADNNRAVIKHAQEISDIQTDIDKLRQVDTAFNESMANLTTQVESWSTKIDKAYSGYTGGKVLYIGGVMTRANNGLVINALRTRLNKTEGTNFFRVVVDNLTGGILKDYADGTTHLPDGFPEISKYDTVVIQIDTFDETVGTTSDFPATGNVEGLYANTVYGQYMYFVDKLRSLKKNVSIIFVAAPDIAHTDEEAGYKPYAIKEVAKLSGSMYVNCFNFRYGSTWTSSIDVDGSPKVVLGDTSIFSLVLFQYWGTSIANKILLCNYIP